MFTIVKFDNDSNIFIIVKKNALDGILFKKLPIEVYGFLKVTGKSYYESRVSFKNMSNDISHKELANLCEMAMLEYFQVD